MLTQTIYRVMHVTQGDPGRDVNPTLGGLLCSFTEPSLMRRIKAQAEGAMESRPSTIEVETPDGACLVQTPNGPKLAWTSNDGTARDAYAWEILYLAMSDEEGFSLARARATPKAAPYRLDAPHAFSVPHFTPAALAAIG